MHPIVLIPISLVFLVAMIVGGKEIVARRLTCPREGRAAEVQFLRSSLRLGKVVGIHACSLLADPRKIDCGRECLKTAASS